MSTLWFPDGIIIRPVTIARGAFAYYQDENANVRGFVRCGESSAFHPLCAIDVERADDDRYVHLRFRNTNRYWGRQGPGTNGRWILATSDQPIDDTSLPTCTLFEPSIADGGRILLRHVQSNAQVGLDITQTGNNLNSRLYCQDGGLTGTDFNRLLFEYVNLQTLVKLPRFVALKGDNDRFLRVNGSNCEFTSEDPNERESAFEVELSDDGNVRLKSTHLDRYLRANGELIVADQTSNTGQNTLFWPVHVRGSTYSLRSTNNNNFCRRITTNRLTASTSTITNAARYQLQELVIERHIYHIRFRMDQARIYDEIPFVAGVGTSVNNTDTQSELTIRVSYQETRSYSFTNSLSLTSGTSVTITAGIPRIISVGLEVSTEQTTTFEWGETVEESTTSEASVRVVVPARSRVRVNYVGTQGTCSVPFSYTQRDKSSSDGSIVAHSNIDGIFEGVNYHSFHFDHSVVEPLDEDEIIKPTV